MIFFSFILSAFNTEGESHLIVFSDGLLLCTNVNSSFSFATVASLSPKRPLVMSKLTQQEFDSAIAKGIEDIDNGRVYSSQEVRERMRNKYGI